MTNVKDLIHNTKGERDKYDSLTNENLSSAIIDRYVIQNSQWLVYNKNKSYLNLVQLAKPLSSNAKHITILNANKSNRFNQINKDLVILNGKDILQEIDQLSKNNLVEIDSKQSNEDHLMLKFKESGE